MGILVIKFVKRFFKKKLPDFDFIFGDFVSLPNEAVVNERELARRRIPAKKKAISKPIKND